MNHATNTTTAVRERRSGFALIIVTLALTITSFLALAGLRNSDRESTAAARSRSTTRMLAAADSGIQLAMSRLSQAPPNLTAFDVNLAFGANVQSRERTDTSPQPLEEVGMVQNKEAMGMEAGASVGMVSRIYVVNTTAVGGGSTVELQAKLGRTAVEEVGY